MLNATGTTPPTGMQIAGAALTATLILGGWLLAAHTPLAFESTIVRWLHPAPAEHLTPTLWRIASALGDAEARIILVALVLLVLRRRAGWHARGVAALFLASGNLLSSLVKLAVDRARPQVVAHLEAVSSASFPSGHAMNATLTWLLLAWLLARVLPERRQRRAVLALAALPSILTGVARIALGVHWPTDVLAGWLFAMAWFALGVPLLARYWPAAPSMSRR